MRSDIGNDTYTYYKKAHRQDPPAGRQINQFSKPDSRDCNEGHIKAVEEPHPFNEVITDGSEDKNNQQYAGSTQNSECHYIIQNIVVKTAQSGEKLYQLKFHGNIAEK